MKQSTRLECNREILKKVAEFVARYPDQRFHQILQNMNIEIRGVDQWYEESSETLARTV